MGLCSECIRCREKNVDEVLQIARVYKDVEKGEYAKTKDLEKAFGSADQAAVCLEILAKGELQLSEKERNASQDALLKEICTIVADKCINPQSRRPVTVGIVEKALAELHFNANVSKPAKKQALEAIKLLEGKYPIERAPMRLKLVVPCSSKSDVSDKISNIADKIESQDTSSTNHSIIFLVHPEKFRECDAIALEFKSDGGTLEILALTVQEEGDASIESQVSAASQIHPSEAPVQRAAVSSPAVGEGLRSATAPGVVFATREDLMRHMKSDWHRHNLRLKSEGKPLLTQAEFVEYQLLAPDPDAAPKGRGR
jgi:ribosome maturation protein SDO1